MGDAPGQIVKEGSGIAQRILEADKIAFRAIVQGDHIAQRVGDGLDLAAACVGVVRGIPQRITPEYAALGRSHILAKAVARWAVTSCADRR